MLKQLPLMRIITIRNLLIFISVSLVATSASALEQVTLQLNWRHQFEYAGYYAALHKGYYQDAGLAATLKEGAPNISAIDEVTQGRADFGVSSSGLVKSYLEGKPVLMLAPIFQHSPAALLSLGKQLNTPADVAKAGSIGLQPGDESLDLKAMFVNEGIALDKLKINTEGKGLEDLQSGKIIAMNAYLSNEPYFLKKRGISFSVIKPAHYGMDFYSDILFTHQAVEKARPEVVAAFRSATLKGWEYALSHQDEIIGLILAQYNTQEKSREHLVFEAKALADLIGSDMIQLGHSNPWRWRHIAETYAQFGVMKSDFDLDGFFYNPSPPPADLTWLYRLLAAALLAVSGITAIAIYVHRINVRLKLAKKVAIQTLDEQRQFVAMVSHEFRTPLSVIDATAQSMEIACSPGASVAHEFIIPRQEKIRRAVRRLLSLLDNVLTNERIDFPETEFKRTAEDLRDIASETAHAWRHLLSTPSQLQLELVDRPVIALVDRTMMALVLSNLLDNALKYSPPDSPITLRVRKSNNHASIEVEDHGTGIPPEAINQIFNKFYRAGDAQSVPGAGLGLYLAQTIIHKQGGQIDVVSETGQGACFRVMLPLVK
jgi:signal transduction histidine kinase